MSLLLFHLVAVSVNVYSLWYDQMYLDLPFPAKGYEEMPFKARLMFLTIWCLILQTVYFFLALLNDIIGTNEPTPRKKPIIRLFKDLVFGLAFPLAINVSISFWGIYFFDKELIFPDAIERVFPTWLNHTMHTTVTIFILTELLFSNKNYPSRKVGLSVAITFFLSYLTWMHIIYERTGAWPYPIFKVLNLPSRIAFFSVSILSGVSLYILGEKLNSLLSKTPKKQGNEKKKR